MRKSALTTKPDRSPFVMPFEQLAASLGDADLKLIDASWYLPAQNRDAAAEYAVARIPGAVFFDQDKFVDPKSDLPHTLPEAETFSAIMASLGISESDRIVVYDGPGMFTAPRVWWMLRISGAQQAYVLDGGLDQWTKAGFPVETGPARQPVRAEFRADRLDEAVASFSDMMSIVSQGNCQIADARGAGRFTGVEPEPRAGMRSGHMPGARNVPYSSLSEGGMLKSLSSLREVFKEAGIDLDKPVVTSCGSGVTAAVITLALQSLGHVDNKLYDGSWTQWGGRSDTPVVTGEA